MAGKGKPQVFTAAQLDVLRKLAKEYMAKHDYSQAQMAKLLDIGQQATSRFVGASRGGISYIPASRLARAIGKDQGEPDMGVDRLFRRHGVYLWATDSKDMFPARAHTAKGLIAAGTLSERTYDAVRENPVYNTAEYRLKKGDFWDGLFRAVELQFTSEPAPVSTRDVSAAPAAPVSKPAAAGRTKRKTG